MKKILILSLVIIAKLCISQNVNDATPLGYLFDVNGRQINGYFDQTDPPSNALVKAFYIGSEFTPGYYYNLENEKIEGFINFILGYRSFKFKKEIDSEAIRVHPDECKGLVVGTDSIAIIEDFDIQRKLGEFLRQKKDFARVIETVNNITFFLHLNQSSQSVVTTYLYKRANEPKYISIPKSGSKFKEMASNIFEDCEILSKAIMNDKYKEDDLLNLIKLYKYLTSKKLGEKIWLNSSWNEVKNENLYEYYAIVESYNNSLIHIKYFSKNDIIIHEASYSSLLPIKKEGVSTWYFPDGTKRKEIKYEKNKSIESKEYHSNGKLHFEYELILEEPNFKTVYDKDGNSILDKKGNGTEIFFDNILNRKITYEFVKNRMINAYYSTPSGSRIFLKCKKNTILKFASKTIDKFKRITRYPLSSIGAGNQGYSLIKCIINPEGICESAVIIKSIDHDCDTALSGFINYLKSEKIWISGKYDKQKITQELVIPIHFKLKQPAVSSGNYNPNMQHMIQNNYQLPPPRF